VRATMMNASFLRSSLFTSVIAFGVAAFAAGMGVLFTAAGYALRKLVPSGATLAVEAPTRSDLPRGVRSRDPSRGVAGPVVDSPVVGSRMGRSSGSAPPQRACAPGHGVDGAGVLVDRAEPARVLVELGS